MFTLSVIVLAAAGAVQTCAPGDLADELESRFQRDQAAREAMDQKDPPESALLHVLEVDRENQQWLENLLDACGWPERSKVGARAVYAAWVLALHADRHPDFQKSAAEDMREAVEKGEASASAYARLVDRRRRLQDEPQRFGMQYDVGEQIVFWPIEAPEELEDRRQAIGLIPFYCQVQEVEERESGEVKWPDGVPGNAVDCDED